MGKKEAPGKVAWQEKTCKLSETCVAGNLTCVTLLFFFVLSNIKIVKYSTLKF